MVQRYQAATTAASFQQLSPSATASCQQLPPQQGGFLGVRTRFSLDAPSLLEDEEDVCAICLDLLHPKEDVFLSTGVRGRTALERLKPRVRIAASFVPRSVVLVRMGPCGHVFRVHAPTCT